MRKKYKVMLILFALVVLIFGSSMTYSIFNSSGSLTSVDQDIAKFVFDAQDLDQLHLSLIDIKPGESREYPFSVSNSNVDVTSDVSLEYQMTLKTYHLVPLVITLSKIDGENEEVILNCDEGFGRNEQNELICNAPIRIMSYEGEALDNYKIKVEFPQQYGDIKYSGLVDYIDVTIKSWQKIAD